MGAHERCETYLAAQALDGRRPEWDPSRRRIAATAPLVISESAAAVPESVARSMPAPVARLVRSQRAYRTTVAVLMLVAATLLVVRLASPWLSPGLATNAGGPDASRSPSGSAPTVTSSAAETPTSGAASSASSGASAPTADPSSEASGSAAAPSPASQTRDPSASPVESPAATPTLPTYVVQDGDTLWAIAEKLGTTVAALREANDLPPNAVLHVGEIIYVPR